jgi:hypothetical protein
MNPTAGSFAISARLQRHFAVFTYPSPSDESLQNIFSTIFTAHLRGENSEIVVRKYANTGQIEGIVLILFASMFSLAYLHQI